MEVTYENVIVNGRFSYDEGDIETITVPANSTINAFTVLGRITASGKYVTSLSASSDGSQVAVALLGEEVVNATASPVDIKAVVIKKGSFNSLGVTFGTGQTVANTKNDLHNQSIEIVAGEA